MTSDMGPPPQRNHAAATTTTTTGDASPSTSQPSSLAAMPPPPPRNPNPPEPESSKPQTNPPGPDTAQPVEAPSSNSTNSKDDKKNAAAPYTIPAWSGAPSHHFSLEVLKDGSIIAQFDVNKKGAYMFGRVDLCDFVLEHPTISRFHAVLQFKSNGDAYIYDLGSTHGTFINKNQVKKRVYVDLHVGDVIRFGLSSRLYIFQGPTDLMPPEADLKRIKNAKLRQEMQDMEASLRRAKADASLADGISWGMHEDAVEETEDDVDEITWQNYKGLLTEKQEKTRDKVIKRLEKIAHMKKEIDAIRAKDIAQGGLTQGQQTQIARNEQRISQIMEELENLEETLNESIRESLGARAGRKGHSKKKGVMEDEDDDYLSDEDEFYDRTQKRIKRKIGENQSVETADSLLDKKDAIIKEMEDKKKLLLDEDNTAVMNEVAEAGDELDAYMSSVSSQLVLDNKEKLQNELSTLQAELNRVLYLLKIADPTGEAARKRESRAQESKPIMSKKPASGARKSPLSGQNQGSAADDSSGRSTEKETTSLASESGSNKVEPGILTNATEDEPTTSTDTIDNKTSVYTVAKPQWLGAVENGKRQETSEDAPADIQENDGFVDYKDRQNILKKGDSDGIESAGPGLIIRKRKEADKSSPEEPVGAGFKAEDAVALLLKHSQGYHASDEEERHIEENISPQDHVERNKKKPKRVLGPERPSFLKDEPDYESWVPPEGQSGDGRTSLNDRLGY